MLGICFRVRRTGDGQNGARGGGRMKTEGVKED